MSEFQFTRYLYSADEVRAALVIAILNKADDTALFWAYELFHSKYDLCEFFWKLYYDFYATLNPAFEKYLSTKFKNGMKEPKMVATVVGNFVIRPHNMDIFLLRNIPSVASSKSADLASTDYYATAFAVMNGQVTMEQVICHYTSQDVKLNPSVVMSDFKKQTKHVDQNLLLLTRIMQYESNLKKLKMGKNMYIQVEDTDVIPYETILLKHPRKILSTVGLIDIDEHKCINLFQLTRDSSDIVNAYRNDWLYAASFSPLWKNRIGSHNGQIDTESKQVIFNEDDDLEMFYNKYDLEPDEQRLEVQEKSTGKINMEVSWNTFYEVRSKNGIVPMTSKHVISKIKY